MPLGRIIDGKAIAQALRAEVKTSAGAFEAIAGRAPHLVVVLASDDPASAVYVRNKGRAAEEAGIRATQHTLPANTPREELLALVHALNADPSVDGILVQLPLPKHHDTAEVIAAIDPSKDVDGLHTVNAGRLSRGDEGGLIPCTPRGCIKLLESVGAKIAGANAVVLGRSRLVGRPVAELLTNRDATVTICHSKTRHLDDVVRSADLVVAAIGRAEMIKGSWIRPGAIVIDVGMNKNAEGKLCGDVAYHSARERASAITPVPGGVGPMTIACLLDNTVIAAKARHAPR
ncbi:bifunctional methylenetetrahydrofolate dehydrogenase/methenyltetrahydrofolate cyclohydrolase FolD [Myxococcota bacterium]|nr:bifunctional methylenetetrahydrofolate dehydrogenase/methenyltetrahydrofolate cyclohydrolase FolD [Myxococcota bacterium]